MYKRKEVIGNCTLYLGDNRDIMPTIDLLVVGSCVTDPPFGLGKKRLGGRINSNRLIVGMVRTEIQKIEQWDASTPCIKFILNLNVPTIIWGGAYLLGNLIAQYFDVRERAMYAFLFFLELGITFLIGLSWEEYKEKTKPRYRCFFGYCKTEDYKK